MRAVSAGRWCATIASCQDDRRVASASASVVPTAYPTDLYTFIGPLLLIQKKGPRGGMCRPRGRRRPEVSSQLRALSASGFSRYFHRGNFRASVECRSIALATPDRSAVGPFTLGEPLHCATPAEDVVARSMAITFMTDGFAIAIETRGGSHMDMRMTGNNVSISAALKTYAERRL